MRLALILPVLMLAACSGGNENRTAGGVTPAEARALDDAAQMLDKQNLPADAVPQGQPALAQPVKPQPAKPQPGTKPAG